MATILIEIFNN